LDLLVFHAKKANQNQGKNPHP